MGKISQLRLVGGRRPAKGVLPQELAVLQGVSSGQADTPGRRKGGRKKKKG